MMKIPQIKTPAQSDLLLGLLGLSTLAGFGYVWYKTATYKPPKEET